MAMLTRRGFIQKTSLGAATVGALITVPGLAHVPEAFAAPDSKVSPGKLSGSLVAHVRNVSTGEIALMVGTREIVYHDRALVARLVKAAR
jgi:hypothetical protein